LIKSLSKIVCYADKVVKLINYPAYFKLTKQNYSANKESLLVHLLADSFIKKDVGGHWNITNLGVILLPKI
jgi:ATP-dependent DNA helicase RecG